MQRTTAQSNQTVVISTKQMNNLFLRVQQFDDFQAFETIFHQYYNLLCNLVYKMVNCEHQAEEIVSEVYSKLWNNRKTMRVDVSLKALLVTSAKNRSIDFLRKKKKRKKVSFDSNFEALQIHQESPERALVFKEFNEEIESWIEALPPKGKQIFRMSRDEGLKYYEIADQLGISIKTVETHMRRSLITLRSKLKTYQEEQI